MRTTNYLTLSALVLGSAIAGCSGSSSTGPTGAGGITAGNGGSATVGGSTAAVGGTHTGGAGVGGASVGGATVGGATVGGAGVGGAGVGGANVGGTAGTATGGTKATGGTVSTAGGSTSTATGGTVGTATGGTVGTATGGTISTAGGSTSATGGKANTGGSIATTTGGVTATGGANGTCTHAANVLSDFESGTGTLYPVPSAATTGFWFSYKDDLTPAAACYSSVQVPTPVTDAAVAAAALPTTDSRYSSCNKYAMHSSIANCQTYSGFGAAMHPTPGSKVNVAVDVSGYDGISFWAKAGSGTQGPLYMELVSKECVPSTAGGTALSPITDQYNCHGRLFSSIPTTWTQYFVPFGATGPRWFPTLGAGTTTCNGTTLFCEAPQLVTPNFLTFQFALEDPFNNSGLLANYDVWIDDVALYKFTDTPANGGLSTWTQSGANAFPKNTTYTGCPTKPTGADGKLLQNAYVNWKAKFVVADGSNQRVLSPEIDMNGTTPSNVTVSEGIGYGMLIAVYMGDKALFDGLLGYWKAHPSAQSMLMTWKINGNGGSGSATDADEDVAFALAMAIKQWGTTYQTDLTTILGQFLANDVDSNNYLKPGNTPGFGGQNMTNPSYFAPAFYKYFATVADTGNAPKWNALTTNVYTQLANITGSNGLVPAWCTANCATRGATGLGYTDETMYQYDSHRTPWRIGVDACWNNEPRAKTYLNAVVGFFAGLGGAQGAASTGISRIGDIYQAGGTVNSDSAYNSMSLIGCAGVGAMGSNVANAATFRDRAWQFLLEGQYTDNPIFKVGNSSTKPGYTYYNATVGLLTAMTMSGNFYPM